MSFGVLAALVGFVLFVVFCFVFVEMIASADDNDGKAVVGLGALAVFVGWIFVHWVIQTGHFKAAGWFQ